MTRLPVLLLCAAVTLAGLTVAAPASAQVLRTDTVGRPIRRIPVWLTNGNTYEFQTTALSGTAPDTVIVLRGSSASGVGVSLIGSDGCQEPPVPPATTGTWTWLRSCTAPYTATFTGYHYLYVYAAHGVTNGTCTVQYRTTGGTWFTLGGGPLTFGGDRAAWNQATSIGRVRFETAHRPGAVVSHAILVATPANYDVRYAGWANSTRVTGAASFDVDAGATGFAPGDWWIYFGNIVSADVGDLALLRNDWFVGSSVDWDQDGLGLTLEASLGTCDRATQTLPGGVACAGAGSRTVPACTGFNPGIPAEVERCRQQLRDTDHDGLRDDFEVYGYNFYGLMLPRYGATPAHVDAFLELDAYDQDRTDLLTCETFAAATLPMIGDDETATPGLDFVSDFNSVYANAPVWVNPDATPGIRIHIDAGVASATNPRETRFGAWGGGGTCVRFPSAPGVSPCPFDQLWEGSPYPAEMDGCDVAPLSVIVPERRIAFHWGIDEPIFDGQGPGTTAGGMPYYARSTGPHVHEFGHSSGLLHSGPDNSLLGVARGAVGYEVPDDFEFGNHRPTFRSRMNYGFGYPGGYDAADSAAFASFSFSSGVLGGAYRPSAMVERCPWPGVSVAALGALPIVGWVVGLCTGGSPCNAALACPGSETCNTSCASVDWDADGVIAPAGATRRVAGAPISGRRRFLSSYVADAVRPLVLGGNGAELINDVLMLTYAECTDASALACAGMLQAESTRDCGLAPSTGPEGAYPGCFAHGTPTTIASVDTRVPISMAIAGYPSAGSGAADSAAHFAVTHDGALYMRTFSLGPSTAGSEVAVGGTSAWVQVLAPGSVATGRNHRHIGVARIGVTAMLFVLYQDAGLSARQFTFDPLTRTRSPVQSSAPVGGVWSSASDSTGLALADGRLFMARRDSAWQVVEVFRLASTVAADEFELWEFVATLPGGATAPGNLSVALVPNPDNPTQRRLRVTGHAVFESEDDVRVYWEAPAAVGSPSWWTGWAGPAPLKAHWGPIVGPGAPAYVIDERVGLSPASLRGLRMYHLQRDNISGMGVGLSLFPFADGRNPTGLTADYNEWDGLQYGLCSHLTYARTAYTSFPSTTWTVAPWSTVDCGAPPIYPESM